ncbi:MAG: PAS domain S-box protein [Planctomycetales bacterium]|nr:PAS domain S-box protein [Planctomycetales bacterium]
MSGNAAYDRYLGLQQYVGWTDADALRVRALAPVVLQRSEELVEDFYDQIQVHPEARRVITGGDEQIANLKRSLQRWLEELFAGVYDERYVAQRWRIGLRHAAISLHPALAGAALVRLRNKTLEIVAQYAGLPSGEMAEATLAINRVFDLDHLIIDDAYEAEHLRRETDAERHRGEVRFRALIEAAACMVVILRPDRRISYFSPFAAAMSGYDQKYAYERRFDELLLAAEQREAFVAEVDATWAGRPTRHCETPLVCADGVERWLAWNAQCMDDYLGSPALVLVGQDCTERREAHNRVLRAERLAGVGQMIAGLAHESRNALQRIQSCTEMLELELTEAPEPLRLLHRIQEAQDTLQRLFDEVRGYSAPITLETDQVDVSRCWRAAWRELDTIRRGRDATLSEICNGIDLEAEVDQFRLVQVFRNLLENSLAATKDPVVVEVSASAVELEGRSALQLVVTDNGPGLPEAIAGQVFEPFFTTKTKGTGLGMAIARRIVDAHGGAIVLGDRAQQGATFVITLPRNRL